MSLSRFYFAFSCLRCNLFKGTDLSSIDPQSNQPTSLFNPRSQIWSEHFELRGPIVRGRSPEGRATVALLKMNSPERVRLRQSLTEEGFLSP